MSIACTCFIAYLYTTQCISCRYMIYLSTPCLLPKYLWTPQATREGGIMWRVGGGGVETPAHTHRHPWKCPRCQEDVASCYRQCAWNASTHRLLWSVSFLLVRVICKAAQSLLSSQYSAIFCSSAFFSLLGSFRHSFGRSLRLCLLVPDTDRGRIMGPAI